MDNKTKIKLLKKCVIDPVNFTPKFASLPSGLRAELSLQANVRGVSDYIRELQREEKDKEIIKIQKKQIEILEQQKIFTKFLALATMIIGISAFFQLFNIKFTSIPTDLLAIPYFVMLLVLCWMVYEIIKYFIKKK